VTGAAWITMALVCSYIWGGLFLLVRFAMRKERSKGASTARPWEP
jgi:hypothetical protein